jgi:putative membrane protein
VAAAAALGEEVEISVAAARREIGEMFTEQDMVKVHDAVCKAERRTRGEIVPMVVGRSARYREAGHMVGLLFAFAAAATLLWWDHRGWGANVAPSWILVAAVAGYVLGQLVGTIPAAIRLVVRPERMEAKVRQRAEAAFHKHGLHKTREGTGILILISLLEHRVQILADKAINEKVSPSTWDDLVRQLVASIRNREATEGLCHAIRQCGDILAAHFPARHDDNPDELRDDLVQER